MKYKLLVIALVGTLWWSAGTASAQSLPAARRTSWENPGSRPAFTPPKTVLLSPFGVDVTVVLPADSALANSPNPITGRILQITGTNMSGEILVFTDMLGTKIREHKMLKATETLCSGRGSCSKNSETLG